MSSPAQLAHAALLGAILERLARGEPPDAWGWAGRYDEAAAEERRRYEARVVPVTPALVEPGRWAVETTPGLDALHLRLHALAKGQPWEAALWDALLGLGGAIPPDEVVSSLLERGLCRSTLGHLPLADRWLWALAGEVREARLTLGKRRWLDPAATVAGLDEVLHAFPDDAWLLGELARLTPAGEGKGEALLRHLAAMPGERQAACLAGPDGRWRQPWGLLLCLLDPSARIDERDDAATDLAKYDQPEVASALARVGADPTVDEVILWSCGASLAEIWRRNRSFDAEVFARLTPEARREASAGRGSGE